MLRPGFSLFLKCSFLALIFFFGVFMLHSYLFFLLWAAFYIWGERVVIGLIQARLGPHITFFYGFGQSIADALKLLKKRGTVPLMANAYLFMGSPVVLFCFSLYLWNIIVWESPQTYFYFQSVIWIALTSLMVYPVFISG